LEADATHQLSTPRAFFNSVLKSANLFVRTAIFSSPYSRMALSKILFFLELYPISEHYSPELFVEKENPQYFKEILGISW